MKDPKAFAVGVATIVVTVIFFSLLWELGVLVRKGAVFVLSHLWGWLYANGEPTTLGGALLFGLVVVIAINWPHKAED